MYSYAGASANGVTSDPVHQPATNRRLGGLAPQAAAAAQSAGTASGTDVETIMSSGPQLISEMPLALQEGSHSRRARAASRPRPPIRRLRRPRHRLCRCSMFSQLFTTGSTATACPGVSTAANESGAAQSVGLGSGIGGTGAGAPAISAGMGQATFVGVLSVPTAGPEQRRRQALRLRCSSPAGRHTGCAGECALGHTVDDAGGQHGRTRGLRFELHSTVIPFTPAAGWPASPGQRSAGWLQTKRGLNSS